ncbi:TPA: ABC transporter transmembrane domain-containing protein, partial [Streptococcus pneumoniae]
SKNLIDKNIKEKVNVQNITSEVISKNSDIKLTGEEEFWINKWDNFNTKQLIIGRKLDIHLSIVSSITNVLQIILPVLTLIVGVNIKTFEQLTLGQIVAISTVSPYFISPIISLSDNYIQLMLLKGYFLRIEDVFNTKSELIPERVSQDIKFDKKIEL